MLATHLIKDYLIETEKGREDKENIFESSKIPQLLQRDEIDEENSLQDSNKSKRNIDCGRISDQKQENKTRLKKYKKGWY